MILTIENDTRVWTGTITANLDTINANRFAKEMQPLLENADKEIILDCSGMEYICSSGLRQLLTLRKEVGAKGGRLTIVHINDNVRHIFQITGFFQLFDIRD